MKSKYFVAVMMLLACGNDPDENTPQKDTTEQTAEVMRNGADAAEMVNVQLDQCTYTPAASIYGRPAAQWRAESPASGNVGNLSLTVWRMATGGPEQFSLYTRQGEHDYRIDTVEGSQKVGSGSVVITQQGGAARFEINGTDQYGNVLKAVVSCAKFVEPVAEGG